MAQLVAALITVYGLFFLSDVYGLFDPSGKTLQLSVNHRRLRPVGSLGLRGHGIFPLCQELEELSTSFF